MKYISSLLVVLVLAFSSVSCAGKKPANLSPAGELAFKSYPYVAALSDFQDGVIAANYATWLDDNTAVLAVTAVQVGLDAIEVAPGGAKAIASKVLSDITKLNKNPKLSPYLASLSAVLGSLQ